MTSWDLGSLARAAGSESRSKGLPECIVTVGTDSRSLSSDALFVALRGDTFDGHAFVRTAVQNGARAVMVDARGDAGLEDLAVPRLVVADTLKALGDMAAWARKSLAKPVVGVTGSNGKTTTKEMIAAILAERAPVHRTQGNLNNLIGLPLTVFAWPANAWAAVLEMGMNQSGEIARLTEIAAPDVGVITMVGAAHLEGLGTIEGIGRAKGELFAGLSPSATAVLNADDDMVTQIAAPLLNTKKILRFGRAMGCDVRLQSSRAKADGIVVELDIQGSSIAAEMPVAGPHNAMNAAAAAACALALGLGKDDIVNGLRKVSVPGGRLRILRNVGIGVGIIDDTYNANPASMRAAFATLASLSNGRKLAVVGDMFELGPTAEALHAEVGSAAAEHGITELFAMGPHADATARGATGAGLRARAFADVGSLCTALDSSLRAGDWLLVKGSRGMKMERVVQHVEKGRN